VIKISFGAGVTESVNDLDQTILYSIDENQERLGLECQKLFFRFNKKSL